MKNCFGILCLVLIVLASCNRKSKNNEAHSKRTDTGRGKKASIELGYKDIYKDGIVNIRKPDSVFWVDNPEKFAEEEGLSFINERRGGYESGENFYMYGSYTRLSHAENYENPLLLIKDGDRFKVVNLSKSIPQICGYNIKGTKIINGRKVVEIVGIYFTAYSMGATNAGEQELCQKELILVDLNNNELVFNRIFSFKEVYPEKPSYNMRFNYHYLLKDDKIEFYEIPVQSEGDECDVYDEEKEKSIIEKYVKVKKPEFWFEYYEKEKKWEEKD